MIRNSLPVMTRHEILKEFDSMQCPAEFFIQSLKRTPDKNAVEFDKTKLSYQELFDLAKSIQCTLQTYSPNEDKVAIFSHKSELAYGSVLGILLAGKTYVPLNPTFPLNRNKYVLDKTEINTILAGEECYENIEQLLELELDEKKNHYKILIQKNSKVAELKTKYGESGQFEFIELKSSEDKSIPDLSNNRDLLAYILFTSGSTGEPKGVMVKNSNVIAYISNILKKYPLESEDRYSDTFDLTFDMSVHDIFLCWAMGGTLIPVQNSILMNPLEYVKEKKVTVWSSVPAIPMVLYSNKLGTKNCLPEVKHGIFAGEKLSYGSYQYWKKIAPNSEVYNFYGPTEATIVVLTYKVPEGLQEEDTINGIIPIGDTHGDLICISVDAELNEVRENESGLLYVSGSQITNGYFNDKIKTEAVFINLPEKSGLWYDTGDIVTKDTNGIFHYIGRVDQQVQVMGYRVELGEIEHVLEKVTQFTNCVVGVAIQEATGIEEIYTILLDKNTLSKKEIRTECRKFLPKYMIPKRIYFIEEYPKNGSGKIDRKKLHQYVLEHKLSSKNITNQS